MSITPSTFLGNDGQGRIFAENYVSDSSNGFHSEEFCPCNDTSTIPHAFFHRTLEEDEDPPVWQTILVSITLAIMFSLMIMDYIVPDWVMVGGLTLFMVTEIITIEEGLKGFSSEGILTVMSLFIVAEGVSRTGALDYYLGMLMGKPKTVAGAQVRLMVPIGITSAFLNNTPIVAVMIPITIRWANNIGVPRQQLLIPLSYATILGGTCTLVGTSTNIIVADLYKEAEYGTVHLFGVGAYGVPNLLIGLAYIVAFAQFLLPHGAVQTTTDTEDLLLGARVTPWSPAAGRTVRRSGLIEDGGVYLVNVKRAITGNVHHSVSEDFVLSVGDIIYFTGNVSDFSKFCETHCLEIVTNENKTSESQTQRVLDEKQELGTTVGSILQSSETDRLRFINHLSDVIQDREGLHSKSNVAVPDVTKIIVTNDAFHTEGALLVGLDCADRPGLLTDISQIIFHQGYEIRHSEAKVVDSRSLSVWRCQQIAENSNPTPPNVAAVWEALSLLIHKFDPVTVIKRSGAHVVRATVTKSSRLIGKSPDATDFRRTYKAGIVAFQKNGKNATTNTPFSAGDILVLDVAEDSPLLNKPPQTFYDSKVKASRLGIAIDGAKSTGTTDDDLEAKSVDADTLSTWKDLRVIFDDDDDRGQAHSNSTTVPRGEFLTAFTIPLGSPIVGKSLNAVGYSRLPGVVLVSIERQTEHEKEKQLESPSWDAKYDKAQSDSGTAKVRPVQALSGDDLLQVGDIIWYTGSAGAIADLQKVIGLVFYEQDEIRKAVPVLQDRRLVQAVVARGSPLIGKSVNENKFRSKYCGVVIAVQRGSSRVHDHPGNIVIQLGDVLLIDASPEFVDRYQDNFRTFALVTEVENSSPPRPALFFMCVALIAASLAVASLDIYSLVVTSSIVGIIMVSTGVVTQQEARDALQWDLFVTIASAFGIAKAMTNSGVSEGFAKVLVQIGKPFGDAGTYGAVYLASNLLSSILTNNAAAALMFPIAMGAVDEAGVDRLKMVYILMLSASDYMTSFGFQTNLMVYAAGGYRNIDFLRLGGPMTVILWLTGTSIITFSDDNWYVSWFVTGLVFLGVVAFRLKKWNFPSKK